MPNSLVRGEEVVFKEFVPRAGEKEDHGFEYRLPAMAPGLVLIVKCAVHFQLIAQCTSIKWTSKPLTHAGKRRADFLEKALIATARQPRFHGGVSGC
jgi:hypothetical protein